MNIGQIIEQETGPIHEYFEVGIHGSLLVKRFIHTRISIAAVKGSFERIDVSQTIEQCFESSKQSNGR